MELIILNYKNWIDWLLKYVKDVLNISKILLNTETKNLLKTLSWRL